MPSPQYQMILRSQLYRAQKRGLSHLDVKALDVVIAEPPEGTGANLIIRYKLPRTRRRA